MDLIILNWFKRKKTVLHNVEDMRDLRRAIRYVRPRKYSDVKVSISVLSGEENKFVENSIADRYFMCGCTHGKFAAVGALLIAIGLGYWHELTLETYPYFQAGVAIVSFSLLVKVLAQVFAKRSLMNYLDQVIELLS